MSAPLEKVFETTIMVFFPHKYTKIFLNCVLTVTITYII